MTIESDLAQMKTDVAFIKGQMEVISPRDLAKLQVDVARLQTRTAPISASIGALFSALIMYFFRGSGHS